LYGWPWYMGGQLLFANRGMCASAGVTLPADGRLTLEEFRDLLVKLKGHQQGQTGAYPFGVYFHKDQTANFPFAFPPGCGWLEDDLKKMTDASLLSRQAEVMPASGLDWMLGLIRDGLMPSDTGGRNSNDTWIAFAREHRLGFGAFGLWAVKALTDKFPMDFEILHFPAPKGQINPAYVGVSGFYVFRRGDESRTAAAMKLARFLTNADSQRAVKPYTQFPTRVSAGNIYEGDRIMTRAWEVVREGRTVPVDSRWPQVDEEIEAAVQETLLGRLKPQEALIQASERIGVLLGRESGAVHEELRKGSWIGKLFLYAFPIVLIFALLTRQVHLFFLIPSFTILALFLFYPLLDAILLAFRDFKFGEVGGYTLQNFARAWGDPKFRMAAWNTGLYTLIVVPANVLTALIASSLIFHLHGRWKGFFRAMYYLPGVASVVVLAMVWRYLFNTELGLFNNVLRAIGLEPIGWLTDPNVAFISVMLTGILRSPGGAILIYLASLANVPKSLYEMADLEGASKIRQWWAITVPLMRHTTMFLLITGAIDALQVFAQVLMLTDGGPGISTAVVVHRIYTAAFRDFDFGLSSAMALMLFVVIFLVTVAQRRWGASESMELA
ncbi:MAG TPA: extracellular solute-binding protein, partial [Candidatus Ozemobacteraceae bacterium]|nr:extracellular solute-binding protein [Candidatus Ozemobacteraceae bacterium]